MSILPQAKALRRLLGRCLDKLLPGSCLLCDEDSLQGPLCPACTAELPWLDPEHCPRCALPSPDAAVCGHCLRHPPPFSACHALLHYEFPADRLIQALKFGHRLSLAQWLANGLSMQLRAGDYDCILPLPLHSQRLAERGFNQSGEIARALARRLALPLALDILSRTRSTASQMTLPLKQRQANMNGAFECRSDLQGRRLLLIDDVMTTGATLHEAARTLRLHGAGDIQVAVAARAFKA